MCSGLWFRWGIASPRRSSSVWSSALNLGSGAWDAPVSFLALLPALCDRGRVSVSPPVDNGYSFWPASQSGGEGGAHGVKASHKAPGSDGEAWVWRLHLELGCKSPEQPIATELLLSTS